MPSESGSGVGQGRADLIGVESVGGWKPGRLFLCANLPENTARYPEEINPMAKEHAGDTLTRDANEYEQDTAEEIKDIKEVLKKAIDVKIDEAGVLRKTLTITIPRDNLQTELDKEFKELITESTVPGFRKGRAPRRLIEKRFGRDVGEQVQTRIVSNAYLAATEREDIKVLGDPLIWVKSKARDGKESENEELVDMQVALRQLKLPDEGDFSFRCEVEVKPEFEIPDLEGVAIEKLDMQIGDEDVDTQVDRIRARRGSFAPLGEDAVVEEDDLLICDVRMTVDGNEVKTIENYPCAARAQMLEGAIITDFGEKLEGAKIGQTRTVKGTLPEDHANAELRGKDAEFELKVAEIKRLQLPAVDAMFLQSMGFEDEGEFRNHVRSNMEAQLGTEIRRGMQNQVRKYLLDTIKLDIPEGMSSKQAERIAGRRRIDLQRQGVPDEEISKHSDELMTSAKEQAVSELKLFFIFDALADKYKIDVSEEELNAQIGAMASAYNKRFDRMRDELTRNNGMMMLYIEVRDEKVIDRILDKAKITETKPEPHKPAKTEAKPERTVAKKEKSAAEKSEPKAAAAKVEKLEPEKKPGVKNVKKSEADEEEEAKASKVKKKTADSAEKADKTSKVAKKVARKKT